MNKPKPHWARLTVGTSVDAHIKHEVIQQYRDAMAKPIQTYGIWSDLQDRIRAEVRKL